MSRAPRPMGGNATLVVARGTRLRASAANHVMRDHAYGLIDIVEPTLPAMADSVGRKGEANASSCVGTTAV